MSQLTSPDADGVLVIGGGIAGQSVCEAIRERDRERELTLLCAEPRLPFDRVSLSTLLISEADAESLQLRPDGWYEDNAVEVLTGRRAASLDTRERVCRLDDGAELRFGQVVLATGSVPLMPPITGSDKDGVYAFRGPEDCEAIALAAKRAAASGGRGAVIGGGLLGLEAAYGIASHGCAATVVHLMDRLMERQLDQGAAATLEPAMRELGVDVQLERSTTEMLGNGRVEGLRFADGEELECDFVVVAVGIRPELSLAREAGLDCDRGILVDDGLRTSAPNAYAIGECAEHRGVVYVIVAPIHEQAKICADRVTGVAESAYRGSVMSAKLKVMGVDVVSVGEIDGSGSAAATDHDAGVYRKLVVSDGKVSGAVLVGDVRGHELLLDSIKNGRQVSDPLEALQEASETTAAELPETAQICNCNGVCKGEIVAAIREGELGSTAEVVATTRAGSGCGSCKPLVTELLAAELGGALEEATYLCPCLKQTREEIAGACREQGLESVSEVSECLGTGRQCGACKPGLAYLVSEVNGNRHREERHARYINDRVHANIQNDGTFSVIPRIRGGVTTPSELRRIADVAEQFEVPMVKITGGQRIDLLGIKKEDLPSVWEALDMPSGHAYAKAVRTVKTCVGTDFCRFGVGNSIALGIELERQMEGLYTPHKVKSSVSGCPRNCAESYVKDIGLVAIEGGWEIYIGGAAGASVRKGDLLATVETPEQALELALIFLQHYRENADYLERTYGYVERVGIELIQEAVLDPENAAALRERLRIAKAAAQVDPWLERRDPVHPRQFGELDPATDAEPSLIGPPADGDLVAIAAGEVEP